MAGKDLKILLAKLACYLGDAVIPEGLEITAITADSRQVRANTLFIAIQYLLLCYN